MLNKWIVTPRQRCDLELLLTGGFAPLTGFLSQENYESVLSHARLACGQIWPIPITLDVSEEFAQKVSVHEEIGLYDTDNTLLARMNITDKWNPDKTIEAQQVLGTQNTQHPAVAYLFNQAGSCYLGGEVTQVQLPKHYDFPELRHTPASLKQLFLELGWQNIIGFQTRNPLHRAHLELTLRAMKQVGGHILINPTVGLTKPGDIDHFTRVRCYKKLLNYYPPQRVFLSLLPLAMRMGGPKEALWHAIIRKNYGCTHFIVGRDHAGTSCEGKPFYDPKAAQNLALQHQDELGIKIIPFQEMVYIKERKQYCPRNEVKVGETAQVICGTQLRNRLLTGQPIPEWFSFPDIIEILRKAYPAKHQQGFTLFFTGLSGSGKTTLAQALMAYLMSQGRRNITLLDGDVIRRIFANDLGFSKADRDLNIRRIGYVASEITKASGITICASIAPYTSARTENRHLISQYGGYIEIYLCTSLYECEKRDVKGLYSKARSGEIKKFTGIDDPYEPPNHPEITIDTAAFTIEESVLKIVTYLQTAGYLEQADSHPVLPHTKRSIAEFA